MPDIRIKDIATEALNFEADHFCELDGATNGSKKMRIGRVIAAQRNALAPRGGLLFNGRDGASIYSPLKGYAIGTGDFSLNIVAQMPRAITLGAFRGLAWISALPNGWNGAGGAMYIAVSAGTLHLRVYFTNGSVNQSLHLIDFLATYAGQVVSLTVTRSGTTITVYVNGVLAAQATDTAYGANLNGGTYYLGLGTILWNEPWLSTVRGASLYNCALTPEDVADIHNGGGDVPFRYQFATGQETAVNGGFESGTLPGADGWALGAGGASTSQVVAGAGVGGGRGVVFTIDGAGSNTTLVRTPDFNLIPTKRYRVSVDAKIDQVQAGAGIASDQMADIATGGAWLCVPTTSFQTYTYTAFGAAGGLLTIRRIAGTSQNRTITLDNLSVKQLGAVLHLPLDDGVGYLMRDQSPNCFDAIMYTDGVEHLQCRRTGAVRGRTATAGNEQLQGAVILPAAAYLLAVRARSLSGTPTIKLGTTVGGAEIVAAVALSTAWKDLTIALANGITTAAASVWVNSTTNDIVEISLSYEQLP